MVLVPNKGVYMLHNQRMQLRCKHGLLTEYWNWGTGAGTGKSGKFGAGTGRSEKLWYGYGCGYGSIWKRRYGYGLPENLDDGYEFRTRLRTPGYGLNPKKA